MKNKFVKLWHMVDICCFCLPGAYFINFWYNSLIFLWLTSSTSVLVHMDLLGPNHLIRKVWEADAHLAKEFIPSS